MSEREIALLALGMLVGAFAAVTIRSVMGI